MIRIYYPQPNCHGCSNYDCAVVYSRESRLSTLIYNHHEELDSSSCSRCTAANIAVVSCCSTRRVQLHCWGFRSMSHPYLDNCHCSDYQCASRSCISNSSQAMVDQAQSCSSWRGYATVMEWKENRQHRHRSEAEEVLEEWLSQ